MRSPRYLHVLAGAFALVHLGLGLRFSTVDPPDTPSYVNFARTLGDQFTLVNGASVDLFRTPGYPMFLRGVWSVFGEQRAAVLAVQWFLLVGLALTVAHFVNTRLLRERSTSLYPAAVLLFLLDPLLTSSAYSQLSELVFACLIFAALFAWCDVNTLRASRNAALSGLWLGLASITRPVSVFLPIVLAPIFIIMAAPKRRAVGALLLFLGASCAVPGAWAARNFAVADIPDIATVGVFNLAHFRAAGVLAEAEGISFEEADAAISARIGSRVIQTAADYTQARAVATESLRAHPVLTARQALQGGLFELLDPGSIYIAQMVGASPRGSGVLAAFATRGPSALLEYVETMGVLPSALLLYGLVFTALIYVTIMVAVWRGTSRKSAAPSWINTENFGRWLILVALVSIYVVVIQAGPESAGRFRIPLLPLWHSVVLATWAGLNLRVLFASKSL